MIRPPIFATTPALATPSQAVRDAAVRADGDPAVNARAQAEWPSLTMIEMQQTGANLPAPRRMTVAAWNIERCKRVEDSADLLRRAVADIVLATEVDLGMARSGQRHTTRDLAAALGMGYIFGTEFVELGTGDPYETGLFADVPNDHGLHGNAILSRYPLLKPAILPLDDGGLWYMTQPKNDGQLRLGGRMAIAAQIDTASGPLTLVAAHYESESDAAGRALQTGRMLAQIDEIYGLGQTVIGGDLNTNALMDGTRRMAECLTTPQVAEPSFEVFQAAGFDWRAANTGQITTRAAPGKPVRYPLQVLDWLLVRSVDASSPKVWPALSDQGEYLSDHELITVEITL